MKKPKQVFSKSQIVNKISYRNIKLLKLFLTPQGKIISRYITGLTIQQQKKIMKSIKRARLLSLLPFTISNDF